jgi:hypothetical protein
VGIFSELLKGVCIDGGARVLVLVNIVDHDLLVIRKAVSHDKILVQCGWQYRVATVVDVLADDVNPAWRSAEVVRLLIVDLFESLGQGLEPWLVLRF